MDVKTIETLIDAFKNAGLTKLSFKCEDFELKLCKEPILQAVMSTMNSTDENACEHKDTKDKTTQLTVLPINSVATAEEISVTKDTNEPEIASMPPMPTENGDVPPMPPDSATQEKTVAVPATDSVEASTDDVPSMPTEDEHKKTPSMPPDGSGLDTLVVKAPKTGQFYSSSELIGLGQKVSYDDIVGMIKESATEQMTEVKANLEGEIVEILVNNGEKVETNQPLIRIKK